jgi:pyruvate kinase
VPGDILLLDDGRVQLKVLEVQGMKVFTEVTVGGPLSNNKGINKLGGGLSAEALTEKDKADIVTAAKIGVDYLAVSFPRCGEDLNYARRLARDAGCDAKIVAKVERAEAVCDQDAMDDVILASDVVMVARGDLGVEIGDPELVGIQKALIRRARQLNRSVITATQMMESMITNPMPTRAEVMDVANAVLDGTDAVMLSRKPPRASIRRKPWPRWRASVWARKNPEPQRLQTPSGRPVRQRGRSDCHVGDVCGEPPERRHAIITMTESGRTALMTSRISSGLPIFACPATSAR